MPSKPPSNLKPPEIVLRADCNQDCLFCLARGRRRWQTPAQIEEVLAAGYTQVSFQGGEPFLSPDLPYWIARAGAAGIETTVFTNGTFLSPRELRPVLAARPDNINVNFPSHIPRLHDNLVGVSGTFESKVKGIQRLLARKSPRVVLTFVINSLNCITFPAYVEYVARNFPGLFYINAYFIINTGAVRRRKGLIPRIAACAPYIRKGIAAGRRLGVKIMVDGLPLCHLRGCEECSADAVRLLFDQHMDPGEKAKGPQCRACTLNTICSGLRTDYAEEFGFGELRSSGLNPERVAEKVRNA